MKVLILSRYGILGASSRLRSLQYVPALEASGAKVTVAPLLDNAYLSFLYGSQNWALNRVKNLRSVVTAYVRRLHLLVHLKRQYDVVWVEKELFPYLPGALESLLAKSGIPYVVDYDDPIFHNYDLNRSRTVRALMSKKLAPLLSSSYAVTAGNAYLADYAKRNGAKSVWLVPTVVDAERYKVTPEPNNSRLRIGWIGSPSTAQYLRLVAEPLRLVAQTHNIVLVTIGAGRLNFPGVPIETHDWSLDTETTLLQSIHIGIMPLCDSPWERGKCGYKLIQYMASARPVIASPIGTNIEIVTQDVGVLANDDDSWAAALVNMARDPELRQQLGQAARKRVEQDYSLQVTAPRISRLLQSAVAGKEQCAG